MCLSKKTTFPRYAFKDIKVYKIVLNINKDFYTSPFYGRSKKYKFNDDVIHSAKNIFKGIFKNVIGAEGVHSWVADGNTLAHFSFYSNAGINEAIIPKGSWYYRGKDGDIVSNRLIVTSNVKLTYKDLKKLHEK